MEMCINTVHVLGFFKLSIFRYQINESADSDPMDRGSYCTSKSGQEPIQFTSLSEIKMPATLLNHTNRRGKALYSLVCIFSAYPMVFSVPLTHSF